MSQAAPLPPQTLRLFDGYSPEVLAHSESMEFVAERLLEAGDGADLRWLMATAGEAAARDVFHRRGLRSLSARSHRFWSLVFDGRLDTEPCAGADFWPLAGP